MKRQGQAFSLVEIMVALAIFSLSIVVISQSFTNGLLCRINSEKKDPLAVELPFLRKKILAITDVNKIKEGGSVQGITMGSISWKGVVTKTDIVNLFKLDLTFTVNDKVKREYPQTLYVFQPSWGDNDEQKELFERKKSLFKSPGGVAAGMSNLQSGSSFSNQASTNKAAVQGGKTP